MVIHNLYKVWVLSASSVLLVAKLYNGEDEEEEGQTEKKTENERKESMFGSAGSSPVLCGSPLNSF